MMSPTTLIAKVMAEVIEYGGLPMRRGDVYALMRRHGHPVREIDRFVFWPEPVEGEPLAVDAAEQILYPTGERGKR